MLHDILPDVPAEDIVYGAQRHAESFGDFFARNDPGQSLDFTDTLFVQDDAWPPALVDLGRDCFQMVGIDAESHSAQVVQFQSIRHAPPMTLIDHDVSRNDFATDAASTIAFLHRRSLPNPARPTGVTSVFYHVLNRGRAVLMTANVLRVVALESTVAGTVSGNEERLFPTTAGAKPGRFKRLNDSSIAIRVASVAAKPRGCSFGSAARGKRLAAELTETVVGRHSKSSSRSSVSDRWGRLRESRLSTGHDSVQAPLHATSFYHMGSDV